MGKKLRKIVQAGWGVITNAYVKGFLPGAAMIYQGPLKRFCVPGMNCYSCPGALGACPIGALQAVLGERKRRFPFYVLGYLIAVGALAGRFICGWLCLFGLVQELLYKIPVPRLSVPEKIDKPLRKMKYVVLAVLVVGLPLLYRSRYGAGEPFFCKYVCPVGTLEGGVPLVLTAHGTDLMGYDKWPEMRHFAEIAMEACKKVICISADNEMLVRKAFPQYADKIVRMRNGYNPDIFYPQQLDRAEVLGNYSIDYDGQDVILFAGKMTRFKGIDILMDAAASYEAQLPNAITVLAGDGEERTNLEAQAADLGLKRVFFIGNVAQDELARLYSIADIDLVPSRREPFGLVAVEAMACGTPVVATNQGGLPDFVNDSVGALVNPEDATDLARGVVDTLGRALADRAWRDDIAAYASNHYSQAVIIRELDDLYRQVV